MRKYLVALGIAGALLGPSAGSALAQSNQPTATKEAQVQIAPAPVTAPLSAGTAFNASLIDSLDTRKARAGDAVTAEIAEDVTYERSVIFPKGTKVIGHIIRASSGGRGRTGSALFIQFDKAVLSNQQEVLLNAGIQALAVNSIAPPPSEGEIPKEKESSAPPAAVPVEGGADNSANDSLVVSTIYDVSPRGLRPPLFVSTAAEGEINSDGLFTPESKGAFGRPDVKIYTPTSQGSRGTVLLSGKKNMHLDGGTRLLLVVQPPSSPDEESSDMPAMDIVDK